MKAPGDTGAFMAPAQKAAIAVISQQGGGEHGARQRGQDG